MKRTVVCHLVMLCALFVVSSLTMAVETVESIPVHFAKGATSITLKGALKGYKTIDYILHARIGQAMRVTLKSSNLSNYFNVLPPGLNDVAIFIGSTSGNEWTGQLSEEGDYKIRVYLMRSAARRNETADYTLTVGITDGNAAAQAPGQHRSTDARAEDAR